MINRTTPYFPDKNSGWKRMHGKNYGRYSFSKTLLSKNKRDTFEVSINCASTLFNISMGPPLLPVIPDLIFPFLSYPKSIELNISVTGKSELTPFTLDRMNFLLDDTLEWRPACYAGSCLPGNGVFRDSLGNNHINSELVFDGLKRSKRNITILFSTGDKVTLMRKRKIEYVPFFFQTH